METDSPILTRVADGTLIRNAWSGVDDMGRETACLYAALVPGATDTDDCPAHLMPQWVADLTPWIDDAGSEERWLGFVRRYALAQQKWSALSEERWSDISRRFRAECTTRALAAAEEVVPADAAYWPAVVAVSRAVSDALLAGSEPTVAEAATAAAAEAAWAATAAEAEAGADRLIDHFLTLVERALTEDAR